MRNIININADWLFAKPGCEIEAINLPHTWNKDDGQDGGNDYYRGTCRYTKKIAKSDLPAGEQIYLEFEGANASATVFVNGKEVGSHDGGYSTWRVNITEAIEEENTIEVDVDNGVNDRVYPQMADFTFYGGLYRDVNVIGVPASHFDLDYYGAPGLAITPEIEGDKAVVTVKTYLTNVQDGQRQHLVIRDAEGNTVAEAETCCRCKSLTAEIENVHLWHGRKDPYLYSATVELTENGEVIDAVSARFGCRTFKIDPDKGFILNGEEYPLRGVSRHQDRLGLGNALLHEHHEEDMDLICEVGATTIRLAHYQHNQYFYDLCDERGMVIWAEIPYISKHMGNGRANTVSQMTELIAQNYNHPSIVVWGLSNEITMNGEGDPDLLANHNELNDLCHQMDPTRLTTIAVVSMCSIKAPYIQIPDVVSYNHYFGWYGGETSMNGPWFDNFHKTHPNIPIGISEYGCEGLNWHTSNPVQGDYTEEYQSYYHEELIKQISARPYLWATHVWNMFDFAADARSEGGEPGQNHKGLVTFDRKYKKDSFYAYKAWLSDEPMVHITSKRYVDRVEDVTKVTVYSNQDEVELFVNGESVGKQATKPFFYFEVKNEGTSNLKAVAGDCTDTSIIRKVAEFNEDYRLKETGTVLNWFDITAPDGRFSLNDKMSEIMKSFRGKLVIMQMFKSMTKGKKGEKSMLPAGGFEMSEGIMQMMGGFTLLRLSGLMGTAGVSLTKEDLLKLNAKLNKIRKPRK